MVTGRLRWEGRRERRRRTPCLCVKEGREGEGGVMSTGVGSHREKMPCSSSKAAVDHGRLSEREAHSCVWCCSVGGCFSFVIIFAQRAGVWKRRKILRDLVMHHWHDTQPTQNTHKHTNTDDASGREQGPVPAHAWHPPPRKHHAPPPFFHGFRASSSWRALEDNVDHNRDNTTSTAPGARGRLSFPSRPSLQ